jgi:FkbM family methyltransferase
MSSRHFHYPISKPAEWRRRFTYALMRGLGRPLHVVRAQGARILVDSTDYIDKFIAWEGIWDGPQLSRLDHLCAARQIDAFIDVGANSGFYSIMFATKNLVSRIIAFEPDPDNLARMTANLTLNDLAGRIELHALALGNEKCEVKLYQGAHTNRGESTIAVPEQTPQEVTFLVRQVRFDDELALAGQNLIIKMDVEGYEFEALAGMARTLRDNACYLQVELYSDRLEELKAWFADQGYRYLDTEAIDHYFTNMVDIG